MSSDPLFFLRGVEACSSLDGSINEMACGIAQEIEARIASIPALRELADALREQAPRIVATVLSRGAVGTPAPASGYTAGPPASAIQTIGHVGGMLAPAEGFDEAVEHVMKQGFPLEGAQKIVMREGIINVLTAKGVAMAKNATTENTVIVAPEPPAKDLPQTKKAKGAREGQAV